MQQPLTPIDPQTGELRPTYRDAYLRGELALAAAQAVEAYLGHGPAPCAPPASQARQPALRVAAVVLGLGAGLALASWLPGSGLLKFRAAASITKRVAQPVPGANSPLLASLPATALGPDTARAARRLPQP